MPLPEKEYFLLEEIEKRWGMTRADTMYYAENGLLEIATRVVGVVVESGIIETDADGHWFKIPEEQSRYCGLLRLREHDVTGVILTGSAQLKYFCGDAARYQDIVAPEDGVEVRVNALLVTRAERDRFEREHGLTQELELARVPITAAVPSIQCSDDGGWIEVHGRAYLFSGLLQKTAIRRLYEAWESGTPRLNMQSLLEDIESGSRHISQVFGTGNRRWREIVGYSRGHVWLKAGD